MSPPKKRPHCRKCGSMMVGHKRRDGTLQCPNSTPSPGLDCHESLPGYSTSPEFEDLEIPQYGLWHRRNPNWVDPPHPSRAPSPPYSGSVISTVLNSDACSVTRPEDDDDQLAQDQDEDEDEDEDEYQDDHREGDDLDEMQSRDGRDTDDSRSLASFDSSATHSSGSFIDHVFERSMPLASLFALPRRRDIPHLQKVANRKGLHVGLVRNPRPHPSHSFRSASSSSSSTSRDWGGSRHGGSSRRRRSSGGIGKSPLSRETSWWMVMGRSADAVKHLVDLQQKSMPGVFATEYDMLPEKKPPPPSQAQHHQLQRQLQHPQQQQQQQQHQSLSLWFLQLTLAGVFGGLIVVYGLSLL